MNVVQISDLQKQLELAKVCLVLYLLKFRIW